MSILLILFQQVYGEEVAKRTIIDPCESLTGWRTMKCGLEQVKINLSLDQGFKGKCLRIDYDLDEPESYAWCQIYRTLSMEEAEKKEFHFWLRSEGALNKIEFKLEDEDGTTYWYIFRFSGETWKEIVIKVKDMFYAWGGADRKLDKIKTMFFAISTIRNGAGTVWLDEISAADAPVNAEYVLSTSQVGYHPAEGKFAVLRIKDFPTSGGGVELPEFSVLNKTTGRAVLNGTMKRGASLYWGDIFFSGDFSQVRVKGEYFVRVKLPGSLGGKSLDSYPFEIDEHVLAKKTGRLEFSFLRYMHCGQKCHLDDPVLGGYHDTMFDLGKRMWSLPHLIYGISQFVQHSPIQFDDDKNGKADSVDELIYAVDFAVKMQLPCGGVSCGGIHKEGNDVLPPATLPQDDHSHRIMEKTPDVVCTGYYVVALSEATAALEKYDSGLRQKSRDAALRAYQWLEAQSADDTTHLGAKLWASTSLYNLTGEERYLSKAKDLVNKILPNQFLAPARSRFGIYGNFFNRQGEDSFLFQPKAHERVLGALMGLIDLEMTLKKSDPLWMKIHTANKNFAENYLLKMATFTPYRQVAELLVKNDEGLFEPRYFLTPEAWTNVHGMNCDHFSYGLVALRLGNLYKDKRLVEFAHNQVQWVLGNNPLNYCMISDAGSRNPPTFSGFYGKGPVAGGIPNGITGRCGEGIKPYWFISSWMSGEYWLPHNAYYLAIIPYLDMSPHSQGFMLNSGKPHSAIPFTISLNRKH